MEVSKWYSLLEFYDYVSESFEIGNLCEFKHVREYYGFICSAGTCGKIFFRRPSFLQSAIDALVLLSPATTIFGTEY
jgi:hypothetical protein